MFINDGSPMALRRQTIIDNAGETQVSVVEKKFFGDVTIYGAEHAEAAEYLREHLKECKNMVDEIKLHVKLGEIFEVVIDVGRR